MGKLWGFQWKKHWVEKHEHRVFQWKKPWVFLEVGVPQNQQKAVGFLLKPLQPGPGLIYLPRLSGEGPGSPMEKGTMDVGQNGRPRGPQM